MPAAPAVDVNAGFRLLYGTFPSRTAASQAGKALLEARLVACVNILPAGLSMYWWEGKIDQAEECVLIAKTRTGLAEEAMEKLKARHPYTCPCVLVLPVESGNPAFLEWIAAETRR